VRTAPCRRDTKEEAMRSTITFGSALALVTLVAALAIGGAAATGTEASHYTQWGLKADGLRLQGIARRYESFQQHRPAANFYTREALNAMGLRWLAMARSYASPQLSAVSSGGGFDWRDAGIGAATGSALGLCLAALVALVRRSREEKLAA
jgi:hypothetical protein